MGSRWEGRSCLTTVGRPKQARALTWLISIWTGKLSLLPVRRVKAVPGGVWLGSASKWGLPSRGVLLVRSGAIVRSPRPPLGCDTCAHKRLMKPCRHGDKSKQPQSFGRRMRQEQASKGRFPKRYEGWGYDARAMMACTK